MAKFLLTVAFIGLLTLMWGTANESTNLIFWLASSAPAYQVVRMVLSAVLLVQIFTHPPRHIWFRLLTGILATTVGVWTLQASYTFEMPFMDTLAFLAACTAIGVAALERNFDYEMEYEEYEIVDNPRPIRKRKLAHG